MNSKVKILLAEDDPDLGGVLKMYLEMSGFQVTWCKDGISAVESFNNEGPDLSIFDVMMPGLDGFEVAEKLKQKQDIPFIFLTARKQKDDRIKGLLLGADDYITKPFEADELVLRIKNILKRISKSQYEIVEIGSYKLDILNYTLTYCDEVKSLTERECKFLKYLSENRNSLIKRDDILTEVWGENDYFLGRSMDVFLARIKKYLKQDKTIKFENVRGVGFRFMIG